MGTFGERLQREREMRGITLEEIAEATKIGTRSLRALEEQDFDKLPGGIFNKGFVRAYSKYLGIDEDQAVADYQTAINEAQSSGKLTRPEYDPPLIVEEETASKEPVRIPWGLLILIALVIAVGFAAKSYYAQHGWAKLRRQPSPAANKIANVPAPAAEPSANAAVPASNPPATDIAQKPAASDTKSSVPAEVSATSALSANGSVFEVKVRAKEDAWVEISADGKRVLSELLKANTDKVVHAEKIVVLTTGNAGGIEVSQNNQALPPLGDSGVKKKITITPQGVQQ